MRIPKETICPQCKKVSSVSWNTTSIQCTCGALFTSERDWLTSLEQMHVLEEPSKKESMTKEEFKKLFLECLLELDGNTSRWKDEGEDHFEELLMEAKSELSSIHYEEKKL